MTTNVAISFLASSTIVFDRMPEKKVELPAEFRVSIQYV